MQIKIVILYGYSEYCPSVNEVLSKLENHNYKVVEMDDLLQ